MQQNGNIETNNSEQPVFKVNSVENTSDSWAGSQLMGACLLSGSCDKSKRNRGKRTDNLCLKNAPDTANTEMTATVDNSHNKGILICFQDYVLMAGKSILKSEGNVGKGRNCNQ